MKSAYIQTKDKAEHSTNSEEHSANEYATDRVESVTKRGVEETAHQTKKQLGNAKDGAKKIKNEVKTRIENRVMNKAENTVKDSAQNAAKKSAEKSIRNTSPKVYSGGRKSIRAVEQTSKTIKQSARSSGSKTIKAAQKGTVKIVKFSVKTAEKTSKAAIKTAKQTAKVAQKTAKASATTAKRSAQAAKEAAKATARAVKIAVKAAITAVKAMIAGMKALVAAIAAGGWVALIIIIVICLIGLILGSAFGIFASGEESDTGLTMRDAVQQINEDYEQHIEDIKSSNTYDILEMSGSRAKWKEVVAIYAVKKNMVSNNPEETQEPDEVATMTEAKLQDLKYIFWEMNSISSRTEKKTVKETVEERQDDGKIKQVEKNVEKTTLYITVSHRDLESMMNRNCFTDEQKEMCRELLKDENNALWSAVLNGIAYSDDQIVNVAIEQLGNVGGQPYWSWYGFGARVEWCACFVSWCANECGYIDAGVIPKYSVCDTGVDWFKERNQWLEGSEEPQAGMIIFFDWEYDGLDGNSDHTGIVEKVENGRVYTIEGNSNDSSQEKSYPIGYYEILGYGVRAY
ncbi:MAG: CHAP domain-containing protein [Ruminococcus sp.]|nr:CHAP domain-containing protein [Ruminococcus sp.]